MIGSARAIPSPPVPIFHAIVLGLVQGLSEFLPISSSGHLLLVPWLFGWHDFSGYEGADSIEKAFDVALHLGTLIAVVAYFRRELAVYIREGVLMVIHRDRPATVEGRIAWLLLLATVPAAIVGALFEQQIDDHLGKPWLIGVSMIVFGLLLWWADQQTGQSPARGARNGETRSRSARRRRSPSIPGPRGRESRSPPPAGSVSTATRRRVSAS